MDRKPTLKDELRVLQQAVPGALVFVVVLLLLRGYNGTVHALGRQGSMLLESFLGGPDALMPIMLHTLPLAISAAVAAFAIAAGWIRFESVWSIVALGVIVIAGTTLGGFLRNTVPRTQASDATEGAATAGLQLESGGTGSPVGGSVSVRGGVVQSEQPGLLPNMSPLEITAKPSVWARLGQIDVLAAPDLSKPPPAEIEPVPLIPEVSGILRVVALAINQLLGFVVAYKPRLFLAAVLAGGWTGWRWQRRLATLTDQVEQFSDEHPGMLSGSTSPNPGETYDRRAA